MPYENGITRLDTCNLQNKSNGRDVAVSWILNPNPNTNPNPNPNPNLLHIFITIASKSWLATFALSAE